MNTPSIFTFVPGMNLRVVSIDQAPWFVAADVCRVLEVSNPTQAVNRLEVEEITMLNIGKLAGGRGNPNVRLINESGLYSLILHSRKPEAKQFKRWVTSVVLPAIRKDGGYVMGEEKVATGEMSDDELALRALQMFQRKVDRLTEEKVALAATIVEQTQTISAARPAVDFHQNYVAAAGTQTLTQVAKGLGIPSKMFLKVLQGGGVLWRRGRCSPLLPKAIHLEKGHFVIKQEVNNWGMSKPQTRVTSAGFVWLSKQYGHLGRAH